MTPDPVLPPSVFTGRPTAYRADWPRSQFDSRLGGVFFTQRECESSNQFALDLSTFGAAEELEALEKVKAAQDGGDPTHGHHKHDKNVPDYVKDLLKSSNPNAVLQELPAAAQKTTSAKAEESKADVASDNTLLKELETALKDLQ